MSTIQSYSTTTPFGTTDICAQLVIDDVNTPYVLKGVMPTIREYTLGFWIKADAPGRLLIVHNTINVTTEWTNHVFTFTSDTTNLEWWFMSTGTYYIYHPKLEIGNKVTDWTPAPEDTDDKIDSTAEELRNTIIEQSITTSQDSERLMTEALKKYVTNDEFGEYQTTINHTITTTAESTEHRFTTVEENLGELSDGTDERLKKYEKLITFSGENGIVIGDSQNGIILTIDTDGIYFRKASQAEGEYFGKWDGENFETGNIVIRTNERAQFGNFAYVPRSDGSLMFLKVGD